MSSAKWRPVVSASMSFKECHSCPGHGLGISVIASDRMHVYVMQPLTNNYVTITSLLRRNDVVTSFRRNNGVIIASNVCWVVAMGQYMCYPLP